MTRNIFRFTLVIVSIGIAIGQSGTARGQDDQSLRDGMRFYIEQIGVASENRGKQGLLPETIREHLGLSETDFSVMLQEARSFNAREAQRRAEADAVLAASGRDRSDTLNSIRAAHASDLTTTTETILRAMSDEGSSRLRERFARDTLERPKTR